jgi:hypothetical protein
MYDPQIGRWLQSDPYDVFASLYVGMGNDPINQVDSDGGEPDAWLKNRNTGQWEWFDNINSFEDFIKSDLLQKGYIWDFDKSLGSFTDYFAGTLHFYHSDGAIEPLISLSNVIVPSVAVPKVDPCADPCTQSNQNYLASIARRKNKEIHDFLQLDYENGQIMEPRARIWDHIFGERTFEHELVDNRGYRTHKLAPLTGTPPVVGIKNPSGIFKLATLIDDEAFVHVTTNSAASNILEKGLDPQISGFVTKWKYVKNVVDPREFNGILYKQSLWGTTAGRFDNGATILQIEGKAKFLSPRTNWVNGVPQYKFYDLIHPKNIKIIKVL